MVITHNNKKALVLHSDDKFHYLFYLEKGTNKTKIVTTKKAKEEPKSNLISKSDTESKHLGPRERNFIAMYLHTVKHIPMSDVVTQIANVDPEELLRIYNEISNKYAIIGNRVITKELKTKEDKLAKVIASMSFQELIALDIKEIEDYIKDGKVEFFDALVIVEKLSEEQIDYYLELYGNGIREEREVPDWLQAARHGSSKPVAEPVAEPEITGVGKLGLGDLIAAPGADGRPYAAKVLKIKGAGGFSVEVKPPTEYVVSGSKPKLERRSISSGSVIVEVVPLSVESIVHKSASTIPVRQIIYKDGESVPLLTVVPKDKIQMSGKSDVSVSAPGERFVKPLHKTEQEAIADRAAEKRAARERAKGT